MAAARRIFVPVPSDFDAQSVAVEAQGANSAISVLTVVLWVFAAVAALAGVVAIGIVSDAGDRLGPLRTVCVPGVGSDPGPGELPRSCPLALVIAGAGVLLAVAVGLAASPLFPIGVARRADPNPGFHVDWLVLGLDHRRGWCGGVRDRDAGRSTGHATDIP